MNILLSDIRFLTSDLQELPEVARGDGASFTRLLQQQLSIDAQSSTQAIEFKDFFQTLPEGAEIPVSVSVSPANVAWTDFPPQQQVRITSVADPLAAPPAESAATLPNQALSTWPVNAQIPSVTGDQLPAGGNSLPVGDSDGLLSAKRQIKPEAPLQYPIAAAVSVESGAAEPAPDSARLAVTPVPATNPGAASGRATVELPAHKTPARNTLPAAVQAAGRRQPPAAGVVQVEPGDAAGVDATGVRRDAIDAAGLRRDAIVDRLIPSAPAGLVTPARSDVPGDALPSPAGLSPSPANGPARGVIMPRESGSKEFSLPRLPSVTPSAAVKTAAIGGSAGAVGEIVAIPEVFKVSMPPPTPATEVAVAEFSVNRSLELPAQVAANPAQPALAALSAGGQGPASGGAAPAMAAVPSALPVPLDVLNPARAADAVEWGDDLGQRVNWMINQKQNSATIRLDPPLLGKLDVQIKMADDATLITIQTQHAQTRDLIETAAVRLRDFLQESGYQNVNVDVSQRQDQQPQRAQTSLDDGTGEAEESMQEQEQDATQQSATRAFIGDGLLDIFA